MLSDGAQALQSLDESANAVIRSAAWCSASTMALVASAGVSIIMLTASRIRAPSRARRACALVLLLATTTHVASGLSLVHSTRSMIGWVESNVDEAAVMGPPFAERVTRIQQALEPMLGLAGTTPDVIVSPADDGSLDVEFKASWAQILRTLLLAIYGAVIGWTAINLWSVDAGRRAHALGTALLGLMTAGIGCWYAYEIKGIRGDELVHEALARVER